LVIDIIYMFGILLYMSLICKYVRWSQHLYTFSLYLIQSNCLINEFINFHTKCFGPFRPSSGVYKQQNISMFITKLHYTVDPLLIVLHIKRLCKIRMFKYTKNTCETFLTLYKIIILSFARNCLVVYMSFYGW
jgi:hypothetical protein